jgi:MOSC domain-containing protein YiiM
MSKEVVGKVLELFVAQPNGLGRINQDSISLDQNGVLKDKFYGKDISKSVLLVSQKSYDIAKDNGIDIQPAEIGENILVDFNPYNLEIGTQLQIGEVLLEISRPCPLCNGLSKVHKELPKLLKHDRGIYAKVITSGNINKSDTITLL